MLRSMIRTGSYSPSPLTTADLSDAKPFAPGIRSVEHGGLTWINVSQPTREDLEYLQDHFEFHPLDFEDLLSKVQRPKLDEYDDYLFMVLHFPVFDKRLRVTQPNEVNLFVGKDFVITICKGKVWPIERFFEACDGSAKLQAETMSQGTGYLLYRIVDKLIDNCMPVAYKIERNVQEVEDDIFNGAGRETVQEISILRRDIIACRRIIKPMIPVISRLEYLKSRLTGEELEVYFSDIGDALARIWDTLEDQKGIIEALNDTYNSLTTHRTNEVIRALTVMSVVMLPLTLVSGIYGMNVPLPFERSVFAFCGILLLMACVAMGMLAVFRQKRWV